MEYTPRLKKKYQEEVVNNLKGNYKSVMQVPRVVKICLNQGIGSAASDKKQIEAAQHEMTMITGQKAVLTKSKKDISNFKLRKGMPVGVIVTLRGDKMYEFLDRFVTSTIPRVRDFNGISDNGFDGRGNYTMGIKEQIAFQEISIDKINKITGMDITFVTNTDSDTEALALLKELGLPFKKNDDFEIGPNGGLTFRKSGHYIYARQPTGYVHFDVDTPKQRMTGNHEPIVDEDNWYFGRRYYTVVIIEVV